MKRDLKAASEKQLVTYKGTLRSSADFSVKTLQVRRAWHDIFKVLKKKSYNQDYSIWQGCRSELKATKRFTDKQKLKEFINTKPVLQEMLKELV